MEEDGRYSVNSMYKKLERELMEEGEIREEDLRVFCQIWKSKAPSKAVAFSWKLLYDRIPTKLNLLRRNCLPPDIGVNCVFCGVMVENSNNLFLHCGAILDIWVKIMQWLELIFITSKLVYLLGLLE